MSPAALWQAFTQQVYLVIKGRYFDDIASSDGVTLQQQTADWTNMLIDELETEVDDEGNPLDWRFARSPAFELGFAVQNDASISTPTEINYLLTDENRYVQIIQDGTAVSNWAVVSPDQISNKNDRITEDTCSQVGASIVFSRAFRDYEDGGTVVGDVSLPMPRVVSSVSVDGNTFTIANAKILTFVKPKLLLQLGVAKNASLPDIVQGGLSPSFAQKYADLFNNAVARNQAGAIATDAQRDDYSGVGGVY